MKARLICLIRRHQWHNGWNDYEHQTVWTCKRCGKSKGDSGDSGDARPRRALSRGAVILAAEACRTNRGSGVDRVCIAGRRAGALNCGMEVPW